MSISGLHVTMVSGLFAALVMAAWRRSERLVLALPAKKAAALAGFLAALTYCLISGFAVPAQRTLYMIGAVALCLWLGRTSSASRVLALALAVVLLADPWAVLSPGYWLSFGAVGVILFVVSGRTLRAHWLVEWGKVQWAVTLGLTPLLLLLFQQVSLISPVANAVAIPLVSLVVTPLALLGAVLPVELPLRLAHLLLEGLMPVLDWLARLEGAVWQQHAPVPWTLPFACLGVLWLLLPRGFPARWLGVPLLVPLIAVAPSGPGPGELWVTVFDVGQGLAVLARTQRHTLLYDTGPRFNAFADSGSRVIFPYLRGEGIARLDALVISHDDNDHAGGALSVLASLPVDALWSSLPRQHPLLELSPLRLPCRAGQGWTWDGVRFGFLHPGEQGIEDALRPGNDRSCVLRISNEAGSLLLTGDIEWRAERELLQKFSAELSADALIVPHHGSTTSSTEEFVERVGARYAVFAAGYRNRFGHPREEVLARYRRRGSAILRTDETGAVHMRFTREGIAIERERERARRYWHSPSAGS
jgi:competence protein ComEC